MTDQLEMETHLHETSPPASPANAYFHFDKANILMETWSVTFSIFVYYNPHGTVS